MFDFEEILRGYSNEQYTKTFVEIIIKFLGNKGIIDINEFQKYLSDNFDGTLNQIVEYDKQEAKEKIEKYKKEANNE